MTYDADDEAELRAAEEELSGADARVDELLTPLVDAMLRMRLGINAEVPVWELKAEGAHVGEVVGAIMREMDDDETYDVLFCTLGRLAALSVRYAYLIQELRGQNDGQ
jgi:hypothetical protein